MKNLGYRPQMSIRTLDAGDAPAFFELRQRGLREEPTAFYASADEPGESLESLTRRFVEQTSEVLGVFEGGVLVGAGGLFRETRPKGRHKATIWGMYVVPEARRRGYARALVEGLLARARTMSGVRRVGLSVVTEQHAARALYLQAGFVAERVEVGAIEIAGRLYDEIHMVCWLDRAPVATPAPDTLPAFVVHMLDVPEQEARYPAPFDAEALASGRDLGRAAGTRNVGLYRDRIAPGQRVSRLHAHSDEEELIVVLEGHPHLRWKLPGAPSEEIALRPGHVVSFPAGTGIGHTFINHGAEDAVLLVFGERRPGDRVRYPEDPAFYAWLKERRPERCWEE